VFNSGKVELVDYLSRGNIGIASSIHDQVAGFAGYLTFGVKDLFSLVGFKWGFISIKHSLDHKHLTIFKKQVERLSFLYRNFLIFLYLYVI